MAAAQDLYVQLKISEFCARCCVWKISDRHLRSPLNKSTGVPQRSRCMAGREQDVRRPRESRWRAEMRFCARRDMRFAVRARRRAGGGGVGARPREPSERRGVWLSRLCLGATPSPNPIAIPALAYTERVTTLSCGHILGHTRHTSHAPATHRATDRRRTQSEARRKRGERASG